MLCLGIVALWWRSLVVVDSFDWVASRPSFRDHISLISSGVKLTFYREHLDDPSTMGAYQCRWTIFDWRMLRSLRPDTRELLGFSIARRESKITPIYSIRRIEIGVPYWFLALALAIAP